jgi:hypothetical protein
MPAYTAVVKPGHWDAQHYQLYCDSKSLDNLALLEKLTKYLDAANDPKLKTYPKDMVAKTIEVIRFILAEERDLNIDLAIDQARSLGAMP